MNLFKGRLEMKEGRAVAVLGGAAVALPQRTESSLARHFDKEVIVGVRPEDLYEVAPPGDPADMALLPARVTTVEPLGGETLLVMSLDGCSEEVMARIGRHTGLRRGDRFDVTLDTATIHLFDPGTTKAIIQHS